MQLEKYKDQGYRIIINKDIEICINLEIFQDHNLYSVDYFDDSKKITSEQYEKGIRTYPYCEISGFNYQLSDQFDELYQALEYLEDEFDIPKKITKQIKL